MRVIGMISGTSFDAVEAVLVELELDGNRLVIDFVEHRSVAYPDEVATSIAAILPPASTTIERVCRLDTAIGQHFAAIAAGLITDHGAVDAVCSHGQTVFHWVEGEHALGTLQLGQPAWIAERTGATVVSDVRSRDIAAGGHGAPLASLLDVLVLGTAPSHVCGSLNLGGIANATVLGPDRPPVAFDIGPANALMDAAIAWRSGGSAFCDFDGEHAARGTVDAELSDRIVDDPYFALPPPKSTGKEYFNLEYLMTRLEARKLPTDDLLATVTDATARIVTDALRRFDVVEVVTAGGGTRNPVLMAGIARRLPGIAIRRIDDYGIPEEAKEALTFAVIGMLTLSGLPAIVPSCTGASHATVLGSVTPGATPLVLPSERSVPPSRLVVRTPLAAAQPATAQPATGQPASGQPASAPFGDAPGWT